MTLDRIIKAISQGQWAPGQMERFNVTFCGEECIIPAVKLEDPNPITLLGLASLQVNYNIK